MNNRKKTAILLIFLGWLMAGIGYGEPLSIPLNTILFLLGPILFIIGLLFLIANNKPNK